MKEREVIEVYITHDRRGYSKIKIPTNINEIELKAILRDLGHISSYRNSYSSTKVYLEDDTKTNLKEICIDEYRSLEEIGIVENSLIAIKDGEPEPKAQTVYRSTRSIKYLYGCPMAQSVEEEINQAERYSDDDSYITTGSVKELM